MIAIRCAHVIIGGLFLRIVSEFINFSQIIAYRITLVPDAHTRIFNLVLNC